MKPKGFILYKNGSWDYVSESKMKKKLHKLNRIKLLLIPYLRENDSIKVFIPVNPVKELLFHRASVQFITSVYTMNYEEKEYPVTKEPVIGEEEYTYSLFEFINLLFYPSKVYGYLEMTGLCDASPGSYKEAQFANTLCIDGVSIKLYNQNDSIFWSASKVIEREDQIDEMYFCSGERYWLDMFDFEKELCHFIPKFSMIVEKPKFNSIRVIELSETWRGLESSDLRKHGKTVCPPNQMYLYHTDSFNSYALVDGKTINKIDNLPVLECMVCSICNDLYTREDLKYHTWGDSACKERIQLALSESMTNICAYEIFLTTFTEIGEILSLVIYADILLMYIQYVLFSGIMSGLQPPDGESYESIIAIANNTDFDSSIIITSGDQVNPEDLLDKIIIHMI